MKATEAKLLDFLRKAPQFAISEAARREVLDRLLALNHERNAEEVQQGLHDKGAKKAGKGKQTPRSEGRVALF